MNLATGTLVSQLPTGTAIFGNDLFVYTHGITGSATPQTQRGEMVLLKSYMGNFYQPSGSYVTGSHTLLAGKYQATGTTIPNNGWIGVTDSWTYSASGTINVPSDATTVYEKGYGIRFKQGAGYKYMYIVGVAATALTVAGGTDYMVANAGITDVAYAPDPASAFGFPEWFNYTPTLTVVTVGNGTLQGRFKISGLTVRIYTGFTMGGSSSMGSGAPAFSNPVTLQSPYDVYKGEGFILDSGTTRYPCQVSGDATSMGVTVLNASSTYLQASNLSSTIPMVWTTNDAITVWMDGILA